MNQVFVDEFYAKKILPGRSVKNAAVPNGSKIDGLVVNDGYLNQICHQIALANQADAFLADIIRYPPERIACEGQVTIQWLNLQQRYASTTQAATTAFFANVNQFRAKRFQ